MSQSPEDNEKPTTPDSAELITWAIEKIDNIRNGQLDAESIKSLISDAASKLSGFFNR